MREVIIDGNEIKDREALHAAHREGLDFPDYYGNNLDALYDCLSDIFGETKITVKNYPALRESLGKYAKAYRRAVCDAVARNEYLHFEI